MGHIPTSSRGIMAVLPPGGPRVASSLLEGGRKVKWSQGMRWEYFILVYYSQFPYRYENGFASLQWQIHSQPPYKRMDFHLAVANPFSPLLSRGREGHRGDWASLLSLPLNTNNIDCSIQEWIGACFPSAGYKHFVTFQWDSNPYHYIAGFA